MCSFQCTYIFRRCILHEWRLTSLVLFLRLFLQTFNNLLLVQFSLLIFFRRVEVGDTRKSDDLTFLTQANVEDDGSFEKLPQIQQSSTIVQPEAQAVS